MESVSALDFMDFFATCTSDFEAYWSHIKRNIRLHWLSDRD